MNKILGLTTIALWSFLFYLCIWSPSGPHRSRMPRRGCHRQVTGGGQAGFTEEILNVSMTNFAQRI